MSDRMKGLAVQQFEGAANSREELHARLRSRESELSDVRTRLNQLSRELELRDEELAQSRALVAQIYSSGSWRITLPLRFLRHIADAIRRRSVWLAQRLGAGRMSGHRVCSAGANSEAREARLLLPLEAAKRPVAAPPPVASTELKTEMQVLQRFVLQEVRGLHESIGSLRALILSEKLSRAEVGYDVVITPNEMNYQHGTGFLVERVFGNRTNILSIRAANHYGGDHHFGDESLLIAHEDLSRPRSIEQTLRNLGDRIPKRIFCVPFLPADLLTAITLHDVFRAPLCLYLMDDQNVTTPGIPDSLMREFLERCSLRLTTHSEMREAYESKYGLKFYLLPAVVPARLISTSISQPEPELVRSRTGALVGSIWGRTWFERLKTVVSDSGLGCHWFGNHQHPACRISAEELVEAGINAQGVVPEEELAHQLRRFPFAIVPTGMLDENDDAAWASALSLPGRILFILATSNTPIILLGSSKTPAAKLIEHFRIGVRCDYTAESFLSAVQRVTDPECQAEMRANAVRIAPKLSAEGIGEWVDRSLGLGRACDDRFEQLMPA